MPPDNSNNYFAPFYGEQTKLNIGLSEFLVFRKQGKFGDNVPNLSAISPPLSPQAKGTMDSQALLVVFGKDEHDFFNELVGFLNRQRWVEVEHSPEDESSWAAETGSKRKADQASPPTPNGHIGATSFLQPEHEFLKHVNQEIENHLDEEDFRAYHLAKLCFICEMQLHRKLKKLANLSPANYIRKYRLWRGRSFLENAALSVSEVCFKAGFRSLEYFSRSFKMEFGVCPSNYRGRCAKV